MVRIVFFVCFMGLFIAGWGVPAAKAASSAYFVKAVQVDVLDESAVKARNKAFIEAQKKAFMVLASRFKSPDQMENLQTPADNILSGMIQDFEISNEQLSTKRYRGVFDFRFKSYAVNQYFGHGPQFYDGPNDDGEKTTLIIPYYQEGNKPAIWDISKNPYFASLKAEIASNKTIYLPNGDISDKTDIGTAEPSKLSYKAIRKLKARYEVDNVVLAVAHVDLKAPQFVTIDIYRTDRGGIEPPRSFKSFPADVAAETFRAVLRPEEKSEILANESPQPLQDEAEIAEPRAEQGVADNSFGTASPSVPQSLQDKTAQNAGQIVVKIFFTSLPEWINIQRKMNQMNGVKQLRIMSLKSNQVDAALLYTDWNVLLSSMSASGFALQNQSGDTYILKRALLR